MGDIFTSAHPRPQDATLASSHPRPAALAGRRTWPSEARLLATAPKGSALRGRLEDHAQAANCALSASASCTLLMCRKRPSRT